MNKENIVDSTRAVLRLKITAFSLLLMEEFVFKIIQLAPWMDSIITLISPIVNVNQSITAIGVFVGLNVSFHNGRKK